MKSGQAGSSQGAQESGCEMNQTNEIKIKINDSGGERGQPKQVEETRAVPEWVERSVWTERMWQRLEQTQAQTVWYSLWDKVWAQANLDQAVLEVVLNAGSAGVDGHFDTIPHDQLITAIKGRIADGKIIQLIESYLKAGVMETIKEWKPTQRGTPQGAVISPLLANLYLNALGHQMVEGGWEMVRYADDSVVLCASQEEALRALDTIARWAQEAGLQLHPAKTRIVNAAEKGGFDFQGYHFERYGKEGGKKWPRKKSLNKLKETLRQKTGRLRS